MVKKFRVKINGKIFEVEVEELSEVSEGNVQEYSEIQPMSQASGIESIPRKSEPPVSVQSPSKGLKANLEAPKTVQEIETSEEHNNEALKIVTAPMSGVIISVNVKPGDKVSAGQTLLVLEAMKMENSLISEYDGVVKEVLAKKGDNVETGQKLIVIS
ncbi:MAG TPA: acetyl-CoA carboxylase biotin carboxyl carrier protein subunit [Thermotogaceae bacterium]|nr:biotin/lipoyl-binding protein [Thermotogota bacterium]HEW91337.1 acetyl-CoA carboxylase biotin carboxyl carrier protein subunit [Thermotogaceae bacterium]